MNNQYYIEITNPIGSDGHNHRSYWPKSPNLQEAIDTAFGMHLYRGEEFLEEMLMYRRGTVLKREEFEINPIGIIAFDDNSYGDIYESDYLDPLRLNDQDFKSLLLKQIDTDKMCEVELDRKKLENMVFLI